MCAKCLVYKKNDSSVNFITEREGNHTLNMIENDNIAYFYVEVEEKDISYIPSCYESSDI